MEKKTSAIIAALCSIGIYVGLQSLFNGPNDTKTSPQKIEQTTTSTTQTSQSTQEVKNDGKEYDKEANAQFASYFMTELNNSLTDTGLQVKVEYYDNTLIYVFIPQDAKYSTESELQQLADTFLSSKENLFTNWAIDNGFDLGFTNSPTLLLKAEDGTTLAEEDNFSRTMKLK